MNAITDCTCQPRLLHLVDREETIAVVQAGGTVMGERALMRVHTGNCPIADEVILWTADGKYGLPEALTLNGGR